MIRIIIAYVLLAFTLLVFVVPAVSASNLMQIYQLAVENDPRLKAQQAANLSARESLTQNTAAFLPSIEIRSGISQLQSGSYTTPDPENPNQSILNPSDSRESNSYSASMSLPVYNHANFLQRSRSKHSVSQSNADLKSIEQALIVRIAQAYFDVLTFADKLALSKKENEAILRQLEHARTRHKLGLIAINDVHEAKARYDLSIALTIEAQNDLDSTREAVQEITGSTIDNLDPLRSKTSLIEPSPNDIDHWITIGMEQNPSLIAERLIVEQARDSISLDRSEYLPNLNLSARYESTQDNYDFNGSNRRSNARVDLNLSLNIFAGGRTRSRVRQSQYDHAFAVQNLERTKRQITRQIRDSFKSVLAGISREKALKQAIISNKSALKATQAGYDIGSRTTVDLLNSRRELFSAQIDWAEARYQFIIDTLRLRQSAGIINVKDIQEFNNWLEPIKKPKKKK